MRRIPNLLRKVNPDGRKTRHVEYERCCREAIEADMREGLSGTEPMFYALVIESNLAETLPLIGAKSVVGSK
ncbi:MAG: hypothetical protein V1809_09600 [Planctomycetota bacterium]